MIARSRYLALAVFLQACVHAPEQAPGLGGSPESPSVAVGPQYDTSHVYVPPGDVDAFVQSFLSTFGGQTTKQVVVTVTPTPSRTTSQLLQTPVGTVSLFGFQTPVPYPFGSERTGYLVTDLDVALQAARAAGAEVVVEPFPDPIGRDAVVRWPGGVVMQLYWHTVKPSYASFQRVPENRVYTSGEGAGAFARDFVTFSHGQVVSDEANAPGEEIGQPGRTHRRIRISSSFGKVAVMATDGHLPYPYGLETTGYEVADLSDTLSKARSSGADVLVDAHPAGDRQSAMVRFPGGYVAEIHAGAATAPGK